MGRRLVDLEGLEEIIPAFKVTAIEMPADRPAKEWAFIPALALLGVVVMLQRRRRVAP